MAGNDVSASLSPFFSPQIHPSATHRRLSRWEGERCDEEMHEQAARSPDAYEAMGFLGDSVDALWVGSPRSSIATPDPRDVPRFTPPTSDLALEASVMPQSAVVQRVPVAPEESGPRRAQRRVGMHSADEAGADDMYCFRCHDGETGVSDVFVNVDILWEDFAGKLERRFQRPVYLVYGREGEGEDSGRAVQDEADFEDMCEYLDDTQLQSLPVEVVSAKPGQGWRIRPAPSVGQEEGGGAGEEMGGMQEGVGRESGREGGEIARRPSLLISDLKVTRTGSNIDDTAKWLAQEWAYGERVAGAGAGARGDTLSEGDEVWLRGEGARDAGVAGRGSEGEKEGGRAGACVVRA